MPSNPHAAEFIPGLASFTEDFPDRLSYFDEWGGQADYDGYGAASPRIPRRERAGQQLMELLVHIILEVSH